MTSSQVDVVSLLFRPHHRQTIPPPTLPPEEQSRTLPRSPRQNPRTSKNSHLVEICFYHFRIGLIGLELKKSKQIIINKGVVHENVNRLPHTYKVCDLVLLTKTGKLAKSVQPRTGPHTVTKVFKNGIVQLQLGAIIETVNIRRLAPYFT